MEAFVVLGINSAGIWSSRRFANGFWAVQGSILWLHDFPFVWSSLGFGDVFDG
jgi:hypothetical protein